MFTTRKNRLMLALGLLLAVGFLITTFASYYVAKSSLREQIAQNELPLTSDNVYSEIQRDLIRPVFISSLMSHDTFLRDWVLAGEKGTEQITRYLGEIQKKYGTFTSFFISDATRNYYHPSGILKQVKEDEERDVWYFRVREMKEDYEINIDPDLANKDAMTIFINYKVFDYDGEYIGATGVGLTVYAVKGLLKKYQERYGRNIYFTDKAGNLTMTGGGEKGAENIRKDRALAPLADKILASPNGTFRFQREGSTVHLNTRYLPEFGWYLFVEQSEEETLQRVLNTLLLNLAISLAVTLVVLVILSAALSSYQRKLERAAAVDKLSGLYNRQAFDKVTEAAFAKARSQGIPLSAVLLDIDHFKRVNDTRGHLAGDEVLRRVARVIREKIGTEGEGCRWGGEEFLLLLPGKSRSQAVEIAEAIRTAVEEEPALFRGEPVPCTVSQGVTLWQEGESEDDLFLRTDRALYRAKEGGRNRVEQG